MKNIYDKYCGIDIHKKLMVACFIHSLEQEVREFATTTRELLELADWLVTDGHHGKHRFILETPVQHSGILRPSCHGGKCPPYESRSGTRFRFFTP